MTNKERARRAIACKHWRPIRGMSDVDGYVTVDIREDGIIASRVWRAGVGRNETGV